MVKHLKDGEDFSFPADFGFTGSAQGRHDTRSHPLENNNEYGDSLAKGGRPRRMQSGGTMPVPGQPTSNLPGARRIVQRQVPPTGVPVRTVAGGGLAEDAPIAPQAPKAPRARKPKSASKVPLDFAANAARGAFRVGAAVGARRAARGLAAAAQSAQARRAATPAMPITGVPIAPRAAPAAAPQAAPPAAPRPPAAAPPAMPRPAPAAAPPAVPQMAKGGALTAKTRNALPSSSFALPGRRYPIEDASHARNALSRVSQHGTPAQQATVRAAVRRRYPSIGKRNH